MSKDQPKTTLTQDPARTKLVEPQTATTHTSEQQPESAAAAPSNDPLVRVKLFRDQVVGGRTALAGEVVNVPHSDVARLTREVPGHFDFIGALEGQELEPTPIKMGAVVA